MQVWNRPLLRLSRSLRPLLPMLALVPLLAGAVRAQTTGDVAGPLQTNPDVTVNRGFDNDAIVRMTKAGLPETIILQTIQTQPGHYDVTADGLITLQQAGVTENVISAMQTKGTGLNVRPHPDRDKPTLADRGLEPSTPPPGVPSMAALEEIGVYYKDKDGHWLPLKTEKAVEKSGGFVKNVATRGLVDKDVNGSVYGAHSRLVLEKGTSVLIYAPSGVNGSEYTFVRFREKKAAREFRARTGSLFHTTSGAGHDEIGFDPERVAAQMYVFTIPADLGKGEYGVLPPGISVSKVFTFSLPN